MYDLAIIGAGAAGIEAAKQARARKLKTILIERGKPSFGGVCLNQGCIPTKFYLERSQAALSPISELKKAKDDLVTGFKKAVLSYLKQAGLDIVWGQAEFSGPRSLVVDSKKIEATNILIATGSLPVAPCLPDRKKIFFAEEIFSLPDIPQRVGIVGGGAIGMEIACLLKRLGRAVTVMEKEDRILSGFDQRLVQRLRQLLEKDGIRIKTSACFSPGETDDYDIVLLAAGRKSVVKDLKLSAAGITPDAAGRIKVDRLMRSEVPHIFACGDVASEKMYAYLAEYQARCCVNTIAGRESACEYRGIPECVYTLPQLARVGLDESQAAQQGIKVTVKQSSFARFSSAHVYGDVQGFVKVLIDEKGALRGATILSRRAAELISLFSLAIRQNISSADLQEAVFLHPSLSEIMPSFLRS